MITLLIYVIFMFAFFGNLLIGFRFIPYQLSLVTEASVYLLFLFSLWQSKGKRYYWHLWYPFGFFLLVAFCSMIANNYFSLRPLISLRVIVRFYLFYLALINLGLDESMLKKINKLLFILFIIQLPAVAYRYSIYGISELTIGTYATHGGGPTAVIPIVAIGYLAGYFFFYERRLSYVLLAAGFLLFGIVGAKRMLLFMYPISFLGIYFLVYIVEKKERIFKQVGVIACVAILSMSIAGVILKYNATLNPEREVGGSIDFGHALKYTLWYTTQQKGETGYGRLATTIITFDQLRKNGALFFGFGPGSITGSVLDKGKYIEKRTKSIRLAYGRTGMVYIVFEYGLLGLFSIGSIFFVFMRKGWKWYKYEKNTYWKAFAMGTLIFAVYNAFIFFCYAELAITDDLIVPIYFYSMAVMYIKMKEITQKSAKDEKVEAASSLRYQ